MIVQQMQYGRVGDRVGSTRALDALPVGAVIGDASHSYEKVGVSRWLRVNSTQHYTSAQFNGGRYTVTRLPEGFEPCSSPGETIEAYKHRFRDEALNYANQHGVSYSASRDTLNRMGAVADLGAGVQLLDQTQVGELPTGTVVWSGNPDDAATYAVWVKRGGTFRQVLGGAASMTYPVTIATINDSTEPAPWVVREPTDEDREAIRQFRAKAWQLGWELKRTQGWCSTYESVMRQMGLTSAAVREARSGEVSIGQRMSPEEAGVTPVGTLFRWQSSTRAEEWALYVRVDGMDNLAGTRKIAGTTASDRNYRSSMECIGLSPDLPGPTAQGIAVLPFSPEVIDALSPGALYNTSPVGPGFIKASDGRANSWDRRDGTIPTEGRWSGRDFGQPEGLYYYGWDGVQR